MSPLSRKAKTTPSIESIKCLTIEEKRAFVEQATVVIEEVKNATAQPRVQVFISETQHGKISLVIGNPRKKRSTVDIVVELNLAPCVEVEVLARIAKREIVSDSVYDFARANNYQPLNVLTPEEQLAAIEDMVEYRKIQKHKKDIITIIYLLKYGKVDCKLAEEWHSVVCAEVTQLRILLKSGHEAAELLDDDLKSKIKEMFRQLYHESIITPKGVN